MTTTLNDPAAEVPAPRPPTDFHRFQDCHHDPPACVGENESVPGIKCDSCGAVTMFHTTLRDDQILTTADHEAMRAEVEEDSAGDT